MLKLVYYLIFTSCQFQATICASTGRKTRTPMNSGTPFPTLAAVSTSSRRRWRRDFSLWQRLWIILLMRAVCVSVCVGTALVTHPQRTVSTFTGYIIAKRCPNPGSATPPPPSVLPLDMYCPAFMARCKHCA